MAVSTKPLQVEGLFTGGASIQRAISFTVFNLLNQFYSIRSTSSGGHEINVADVCKDDQFCLHYPRVEQFGSREIKQMPPVRQRLGLN